MDIHMERTDVFPWRIRWLAIATGFAAALALFPALLLLDPALLIAGGIIQPRFPSAGKWLVWAGTAGLSVVLITYDVLIFPGPLPHPYYMRLTFSTSTILIAWCCVELVVDGVKRTRAWRSMPPVEPRPVSRSLWIFAAVLTLVIGWGAVQAPSGYRHSGSLSMLAMSLVDVVIVAASDISLIRRFLALRRTRRADL